MNLVERSYEKEFLDRDDIPFADIRQNMKELNIVNTLLGGHAISVRGLKLLLHDAKEITICEVGCGGADNMIALSTWCSRNNIKASFIGIDLKPECIAYAKKQMPGGVTWITSDYRSVRFNPKPDIIYSSLLCHHFSDDELVGQIRWMHNNSTRGFFINDLHRHPLAYRSIKLLTKLFSSSYLVKNDAPLSVARGFKKEEWQSILNRAGIKEYSLTWQWAFRHLLVCSHE
ncbi:methyltransferase domain-containing protein [Segetibacter sp. 3557_3]|uniref:methyltransferase domain-containing protein n=1 Tax=Segetibacter sp. 3557_3 TaxID=2547429 RepID=UPI0010585C57|nr:methyltransferase domain-containing protein [Segetibacter sp. 3557_3]TDH23082.1 methyltransferase domain-containing protein [Segetibacter sp. 3557_3]